MCILCYKPSVPHFRSKHIFSRMHQICNIKFHILNLLVIICPSWIQLMICNFLSIQMKNKLSKTTNICCCLYYFFFNIKLFAHIKWFLCSLGNPISKFVHFILLPSYTTCFLNFLPVFFCSQVYL